MVAFPFFRHQASIRDSIISYFYNESPSLSTCASIAHQRATNYSNVGVVQGIAYVDFGFIEPALHGLLRKLRRTVRRHRKVSTGSLLRV